MIVFWLPVAAGAVVGRLSGGRLTGLTSLHLRYVWIVVLAVAAQAVFVLAPPATREGFDPLRIWLPVTTAAIWVFVALNRALPGMWLVLAGVSANLLVISVNGGLMPINPEALVHAGRVESVEAGRSRLGERLPGSKDVVLEEHETRLRWLRDWIVSPPLPQRKVVSLGDLAMAVGLGYLTFRTMRASRATQVENSSKEQQRDAAMYLPHRASIGSPGPADAVRAADAADAADAAGAAEAIGPVGRGQRGRAVA